jgi:hypothetical protein
MRGSPCDGWRHCQKIQEREDKECVTTLNRVWQRCQTLKALTVSERWQNRESPLATLPLLSILRILRAVVDGTEAGKTIRSHMSLAVFTPFHLPAAISMTIHETLSREPESKAS